MVSRFVPQCSVWFRKPNLVQRRPGSGKRLRPNSRPAAARSPAQVLRGRRQIRELRQVAGSGCGIRKSLSTQLSTSPSRAARSATSPVLIHRAAHASLPECNCDHGRADCCTCRTARGSRLPTMPGHAAGAKPKSDTRVRVRRVSEIVHVQVFGFVQPHSVQPRFLGRRSAGSRRRQISLAMFSVVGTTRSNGGTSRFRNRWSNGSITCVQDCLQPLEVEHHAGYRVRIAFDSVTSTT